ncbi:MAG: disulfide bond formation protein B [Burkholderiales bacterium]|jgi:disulfide bond formation protein DsbB|nr:disulfide bond formation protein B [Burkholderiales bacterium]
MFCLISRSWNELRRDFWNTFADWQDRRTIWIVGGLAALFLDIFAWVFFQEYLQLSACEMCVYIRFSMLVIFLGAMFTAIRPNHILFKTVGYIVVIWAIARGSLWSIRLEKMYQRAEAIRNGADFFSFGGLGHCSLEPTFPFGIPLHQWLPKIFSPSGICGEENWRLLGLNMAEWMLVIYACFSILLACMLIGWFVRGIRCNKK